jgi:alkylhydroperoxidase family enzyme
MKRLLLSFLMLAAIPLGARAEPHFPALSDAETWQRLPREEPPLPAWARVLVGSLPKTTAAMLQLDYVQREKNPLGPVLAGRLRWAAADADGCAYAQKYAEADLRRAGQTEADLAALAAGGKGLPEAERLALAFARKMSRAAHEVTDAEMAELLKHYGPEKVTAMVHTLAYTNFRDRIILALGVEVEPGGPLPPLDLRPDSIAKDKAVSPPRKPWKEGRDGRATAPEGRPGWLDHDYAAVQKALSGQKERTARIPLPPLERLEALPADVRERTKKIVWSRVSMGYQPVLTKAWFDCMGTFQKEAELDEVFANTFFWVVTRSNDCFY